MTQDVAAFGEVYRRVTWGLGGMLLCPQHQCLLISECPRCFRQADYQPINGRLRIWCGTCAAGADSTLPPDQIPVWPLWHAATAPELPGGQPVERGPTAAAAGAD